MKRYVTSCLLVAMTLFSLPSFAQTERDTTLLGLPGDNLDLYAVLDLFQKSKTIEEFEKSLNLEKTGINNLDLDLDQKVDFIKVVTTNEGDDFTFILQDEVSKTETQDVAVILVSKDKDKKITMQIVGDEDLYGKNYIVELKESKTPAVTANPGYTGTDTVKIVSAPAKTTTVVVETTPIVQYVYSPAYAPYYPPYTYGYYPPYYSPFFVMSVGIYIGHHSYYHGGYGYHGNTTVIHNTNNFNNYNNSRNRSNAVNNNKANGNYNRGNNASTRPASGSSNRPSAGTSNRPSGGTSPSTRPSNGSGGGRQSSGVSPSTRPSNNYSSQQRPSSNGASRYSSGGGGNRGGGGFSGGGSRGGGGGRRR